MQPTISVIDGKSFFTFDRQLILDLGVGMKLQTNKDESTVSLNNRKKTVVRNCKICSKKSLTAMRMHVGCHILKGEGNDSNTCGFCGLNSCSNVLIQTSKKGADKHYRIQSQCSYAETLKRAPVFSARNKCTNYLIKCVICGIDMWTYNANKHYFQHGDIECPIFIGQAQKTAMLK